MAVDLLSMELLKIWTHYTLDMDSLLHARFGFFLHDIDSVQNLMTYSIWTLYRLLLHDRYGFCTDSGNRLHMD